jgi:hypothetical protein
VTVDKGRPFSGDGVAPWTAAVTTLQVPPLDDRRWQRWSELAAKRRASGQIARAQIHGASECGGLGLCDRRTRAVSDRQANDHAAYRECEQNGGCDSDPTHTPDHVRARRRLLGR